MSDIKLLFKQRFFSWFDSYDIYDETGSIMFVVKGELAWGHLLRISDSNGSEMGLSEKSPFLGSLNLRCIWEPVISAASARNLHSLSPNLILTITAGKWKEIGWNGIILFWMQQVKV